MADPTPREMAERLLALQAKATPGEWRVALHNRGPYYGNLTSDLPDQPFGVGMIRTIGLVLKYADPAEQQANAELWAAARNSIPSVCTALIASQDEAAKLRERVRELEEAACDVVAGMRSTFKARNGREVGIQDDSGEKCWIIGHEPIEALERALAAHGGSDGQ